MKKNIGNMQKCEGHKGRFTIGFNIWTIYGMKSIKCVRKSFDVSLNVETYSEF